jgi:hypothetical protein
MLIHKSIRARERMILEVFIDSLNNLLQDGFVIGEELDDPHGYPNASETFPVSQSPW